MRRPGMLLLVVLLSTLGACSSGGEKEPGPSAESAPSFDPLTVPEPVAPVGPDPRTEGYARDFTRYFMEELVPYTEQTGYATLFRQHVGPRCETCNRIVAETDARQADGTTIPRLKLVVDDLTFLSVSGADNTMHFNWWVRVRWHYAERDVRDADGRVVEEELVPHDDVLWMGSSGRDDSSVLRWGTAEDYAAQAADAA
ncbi:hypothetical protein [Nocardioides lijunqiniae]|uniref:hypothetical protein n=1 Tax=Nocardioides lijunqiniae TaxID=2760832 RepID=UPI001877FF48|nr:hypothetical protein [Nocardioides lijunqiniae]